jgi:hypothetical protein
MSGDPCKANVALMAARGIASKAGFYTDWYSSNGSPTFSISGMVHLRSKALARTILKIC